MLKSNSTIISIAVIFGLAISFNLARKQLHGIESEPVVHWVPQIIFGYYFTIFTLAIQGFRELLQRKTGDLQGQALLYLMFIGLCLNMILINISEAETEKSADYGLVIFWNTVMFFLWLRAVDLCNPKYKSK